MDNDYPYEFPEVNWPGQAEDTVVAVLPKIGNMGEIGVLDLQINKNFTAGEDGFAATVS